MRKPWLLMPGAWRNLSEKGVFQNALRRFGELAARGKADFPVCPTGASDWVRDAIADEKRLLDGDAAVIFPLAGAPPQLARVWAASRSSEACPSLPLDGADVINEQAKQKGIRLSADLPEGATVTGRSWQLASCLAMRALADDISQETRIRLAKGFIVTGAVDGGGDVVQTVVIGNKLEGIGDSFHRRWLYPACDSDAFAQQAKEEIPREPVSTVQGALAAVVGYGTRRESPAVWPETIKVMHALVGGSVYANLVAALISRPTELHLWHSDNEEHSVNRAKQLKAYLAKLAPDISVELHVLSNNDLAVSEETLGLYLSVAATKGKALVYFNITSGNRLMSYAVHRWSRENPDLRLIYRERDAKDLEYVQIWHENAASHTCTLRPEHLTDMQTDDYGPEKGLLSTSMVNAECAREKLLREAGTP